MKTSIKNVRVLFAKAFNVDNASGTNLFCHGEFTSDESCEGEEISKVLGDFSILERLRGQLPCVMDLDVELVSGGKDKMTIKLLDFKVTGKPTNTKPNAA